MSKQLAVILIHDEPSLAKQSQALGEHPDLEVQEKLRQGNTRKKFAPRRSTDLGKMGLRVACPFLPQVTSEISPLPLCISFLWLM